MRTGRWPTSRSPRWRATAAAARRVRAISPTAPRPAASSRASRHSDVEPPHPPGPNEATAALVRRIAVVHHASPICAERSSAAANSVLAVATSPARSMHPGPHEVGQHDDEVVAVSLRPVEDVVEQGERPRRAGRSGPPRRPRRPAARRPRTSIRCRRPPPWPAGSAEPRRPGRAARAASPDARSAIAVAIRLASGSSTTEVANGPTSSLRPAIAAAVASTALASAPHGAPCSGHRSSTRWPRSHTSFGRPAWIAANIGSTSR